LIGPPSEPALPGVTFEVDPLVAVTLPGTTWMFEPGIAAPPAEPVYANGVDEI
jgi:hypothetical protein